MLMQEKQITLLKRTGMTDKPIYSDIYPETES